MKDLIGKKILGFEFSGQPGFNSSMVKLIGEEGTIKSWNPRTNVCCVQYKYGESWVYPYPEILEHLVKEEKTIDDIIIEMKQLTSQVWNQKI